MWAWRRSLQSLSPRFNRNKDESPIFCIRFTPSRTVHRLFRFMERAYPAFQASTFSRINHGGAFAKHWISRSRGRRYVLLSPRNTSALPISSSALPTWPNSVRICPRISAGDMLTVSTRPETCMAGSIK
ncbi:MAG: hypothetical protein AMXMBFR4_14510 [Candidatus Hydrogenedentota bacterium]